MFYVNWQPFNSPKIVSLASWYGFVSCFEKAPDPRLHTASLYAVANRVGRVSEKGTICDRELL